MARQNISVSSPSSWNCRAVAPRSEFQLSTQFWISAFRAFLKVWVLLHISILNALSALLFFLKGAKFVDNWNTKEAIADLYSHSYDPLNNFKDTTQFNFLVKSRNYDHVVPRSSTSLPLTAEQNSSNVYMCPMKINPSKIRLKMMDWDVSDALEVGKKRFGKWRDESSAVWIYFAIK